MFIYLMHVHTNAGLTLFTSLHHNTYGFNEWTCKCMVTVLKQEIKREP